MLEFMNHGTKIYLQAKKMLQLSYILLSLQNRNHHTCLVLAEDRNLRKFILIPAIQIYTPHSFNHNTNNLND